MSDEAKRMAYFLRAEHLPIGARYFPPAAVQRVRHSLSEGGEVAVSVAVKALAALCRQGIEQVELDGETIDLWDVKRDLRGLLGPAEVD